MSTLRISKLKLTNFRNLSDDLITFSPGINCIFGKNGNGKTNILEAIHVLATKKSFRKNTSFPQLLSFDCENPEIIFQSAWLDSDEKLISITGKMEDSGNQWYLNNSPVKKIKDAQIVFINPFDSFNFHGSASFRRNWIDTHIGKIDATYKRSLRKYTDSLRFRNSLLSKKPSHYREQILAIDPEMAKLSKEITERRIKFLDELKEFTTKTFKDIFAEEHHLTLGLDSRFLNLSEEEIFNQLQSGIQKDVIIGHTSYGIHKDDYTIFFDGLNAYEFCSLGQQKMGYLSLLFAYIELFRYIYASYPMVLIDDVSGELDKLRWQRLVEYLERRNYQVLITTANEKFKEELDRIDGANKIYVDLGSIL